ncbi:hypothetical protein [Geotalea toluenoxydans]|uniref:hypothetical protein n=1 Tax=Geotalea toluenoxydans TaxID=421624 RepID=UPI0006D1E1B9|nr:hypothetical protein [Geotalea toluenoxydans]
MRISYLLPLLLFSLLVSMTGCGSDNTANQAVSAFAASEKCITCHNTSDSISSVTGAKINDEWARSAHNTMHGASCIDCHGSGNGHPNNCGGCMAGRLPRAWSSITRSRQARATSATVYPTRMMPCCLTLRSTSAI